MGGYCASLAFSTMLTFVHGRRAGAGGREGDAGDGSQAAHQSSPAAAASGRSGQRRLCTQRSMFDGYNSRCRVARLHGVVPRIVIMMVSAAHESAMFLPVLWQLRVAGERRAGLEASCREPAH